MRDDQPGKYFFANVILIAAPNRYAGWSPHTEYVITRRVPLLARSTLGVAEAGALVEHALAAVSRGLVDLGVQQLVVAGGETSGACVQALGIAQLQIGPQIDPGVPWTLAADGKSIALALKSGNFGTVDFFTKALTMLETVQ